MSWPSVEKASERQLLTVDLQPERFVSLCDVDLSANCIVRIPENLFSRNKHLKSVNFSGNLIDRLPINLGCRHITHLNFARNCLRTIDENHLDYPHLIDLNLASNRIELLAATAFDRLVRIESLDLNTNQIRNLSAYQFQNAFALRHLNCDRNRLEHLLVPKLFRRCVHLELVSFVGNCLALIDDDLFAANTQLRVVNFADNCLMSVPDFLLINQWRLEELAVGAFRTINLILLQNFRVLRSLQFYDFGHEQRIDRNFFDLLNLFDFAKVLQVLRLKCRQCDSLEFINLQCFVNLRIFEFECCSFRGKPVRDRKSDGEPFSLDETFRYHDQLERISLRHLPNYRIVPADQLSLNRIAYLELVGLQQTYWLQQLATYPHLLELRISNASIRYVASNAFVSLANLKRLMFRATNLKRIVQHLFASNRNLIELDLAANRIETIARAAFANCERLQRLNLNGNRLRFLKITDTFAGLTNRTCISIGNNPWMKTMSFESEQLNFQRF